MILVMVVDMNCFYLVENFILKMQYCTKEDALNWKVLTFLLFVLQVLGFLLLISVLIACLFGCLYLLSPSPFFPLFFPEVSCAWSSWAHLLSPQVIWGNIIDCVMSFETRKFTFRLLMLFIRYS